MQGRCAEGDSPDHCQFPAPQRITDPVYYSRHDWPPPTGYSFSHSTIGVDTDLVQNFRFADGGFGLERTRRDDIVFRFIENDRARLVPVDTIVSEHYDDREPVAARLMERFYYGYNWVGSAGSGKIGPAAYRFIAKMSLCIAQRLSEWRGRKLADDRLSHVDQYSIREWRTHRANRLALKEEQGIA